MFQNNFHEFLIQKLNENTKGLTFSGEYFYSVDLKGNFIVERQIEGTYRVEDIEYIPAQVVEWNNTQQPYKDIDLQDISIPLRVACREVQLNDCFEALNEFRESLNGESEVIDGYNVGFRVGQPTPPISPQQDAGNTWILIDIIINASASKNTLYGNDILKGYKMGLHGTTLQEVIASDITITTTTENNTKAPLGETTVSNNKRTRQYTMTIFYKDNISVTQSFLDWLWSDLTLNQTFDIEIPYTATITKTDEVVITNMQQALQYGVPVGFIITMYSA